MIRISQMKLPVGHTREQLEKKIAKITKIEKKNTVFFKKYPLQFQ